MKTTDKKWNIRRLWILAMFFFVAFFSLSAQIPYAIWCSGNHTLYFTFTGKEYKSGGTFDGQYITNVWKGNAVVESGIQPQWNATVRSSLQYVEFDSLFRKALPESTSEWFYRCKKLKSIRGLEYLHTSEVTDMGEMFRECELLTTLDLTRFKTENVTDMNSMFRGCTNLKQLNVSWFNTWQVEDMSHMFEGCSSLTDITFFTLLNHRS